MYSCVHLLFPGNMFPWENSNSLNSSALPNRNALALLSEASLVDAKGKQDK